MSDNKSSIQTILEYIHNTSYDCDELEVDLDEDNNYVLCHYDGHQSVPLDYPPVSREHIDSKSLRAKLDELGIAQCF